MVVSDRGSSTSEKDKTRHFGYVLGFSFVLCHVRNKLPEITLHPQTECLVEESRTLDPLVSMSEVEITFSTRNFRSPPYRYRKDLYPLEEPWSQ